MQQDNDNQGNNTGGMSAPPEPTVQPAGQSVEDTHLPPMPPHESHESKRKVVLISVCTVVLLALIGGLTYILTAERSVNENPESNTVATSEEENHGTMSAAEHIVNELKTKVAGTIQRVDLTTEQGGTGPTDGIVFSAAAYQSGDQQFAVYPVTPYGFGTYMSTPEEAASDKAIIEASLKEHGFEETLVGSGIYASSDVACAIRLFDQSMGGHDGIGLGCGNLDEYDTKYQAALPFFTAYQSSKPEASDDLILSDIVTKDGADNYTNAHVDIGSLDPEVPWFSALFYQPPNTDKWTFFTSSRTDLSCDIFSTDVLEKAFDGQRCIDAAGNETSVRSE